MAKKKKDEEPRRKATTNRRALAKFHILETLEAGIALQGSEVKSLRMGEANLQDGFVRIDNEQAYLWNVHIAPYSHGSRYYDASPTRTRKLLLKKFEIKKLFGKTTIKGLTIIPLEIYFNKRGMAKVKIGLAKGKKTVDRRDDIKKRMVNREMRREFAEKQKS